jgi:hypothetical protein
MYLIIKKLGIGHVLLLDCFTFLKQKKYTILSFLTLVVFSRLVADSKAIMRFHNYLVEHNKYYEVSNTMKTLSTSLSKRFHFFDKYIDPPIKYSKVIDLNSKVDRAVPITDLNIAQIFCNSEVTLVELISTLFETLYKMAETFGMDLNQNTTERNLDPELKEVLIQYLDTFLMSYDLIGSCIMGDYYLNTRNTNIQKMIKLSLYYGLEDLSQQIIAFISKECLFQRKLFLKK